MVRTSGGASEASTENFLYHLFIVFLGLGSGEAGLYGREKEKAHGVSSLSALSGVPLS
jgi:hypothetical protein